MTGTAQGGWCAIEPYRAKHRLNDPEVNPAAMQEVTRMANFSRLKWMVVALRDRRLGFPIGCTAQRYLRSRHSVRWRDDRHDARKGCQQSRGLRRLEGSHAGSCPGGSMV